MPRSLADRLRSLTDRVGRRMSAPTLKIGVSARILHPQPGSRGLQSKTLQYLEQTAAHWLMSRNVLVLMVPTVDTGGLLHRSEVRLSDYARHLDGLMLQGGADVCPLTYGEDPLAREWVGDRLRDEYEIELLHSFIEAGKPVLGVSYGPAIEVYYLAAAWCLACMAAMYLLAQTPLGRMANAVRDNPERAEFVGYSQKHVRLLSFTGAGFFAGVAGGLFALNYEIVTEETVNLVTDRKSTRLNSSHMSESRMPSSA